jgi:two-component system nitrogen regulation response regulator GlnG
VHDLDEAAGPLAPASVEGDAWESALAAWARAQLHEGAPDLHARARSRLDRVLLEAALAHSEGHRGAAAEKLGVGRNTLTRKLGPGRKRR